uniref:Uncharacterized protein n=1 Tax=Picea glauca TaxID=3330 RepID=A0A101LVU0_PICGL|nr:hypothetical protein ABT39_MTgene1768 [Picea glauca]QHR87968.1 hypothetical protein Q903MT_gene1980 [Picea sitchensis]
MDTCSNIRNRFTLYLVLIHLVLAWLIFNHNSFLQEMLLVGELILMRNAIWRRCFRKISFSIQL